MNSDFYFRTFSMNGIVIKKSVGIKNGSVGIQEPRTIILRPNVKTLSGKNSIQSFYEECKCTL